MKQLKGNVWKESARHQLHASCASHALRHTFTFFCRTSQSQSQSDQHTTRWLSAFSFPPWIIDSLNLSDSTACAVTMLGVETDIEHQKKKKKIKTAVTSDSEALIKRKTAVHLILRKFDVICNILLRPWREPNSKAYYFCFFGGKDSDGVADPRAGRGPDMQDVRRTVVHSHVFPFNPLQEVRAAWEEWSRGGSAPYTEKPLC